MTLPEHLICSVMVAQLGYRQRYGWKAVPIIALAGIAPDADCVTKLIYEPWFWTMHHALGHGLLPLTVLALLIGSVGAKWAKLPILPIVGWCFAAGVVHGLCDMPYFWGVQWLWPFSTVAWAFHAIKYLDLFILGAWLLSAWLLYRKPQSGFFIAVVTLSGIATYIGLRMVLPQPTGWVDFIAGGWIYAAPQETPVLDWW